MTFFIRFCFVFLLSTHVFCIEDTLKIDVFVPDFVMENLDVFLNGRDIATLDNFSGIKNRRDTIEYVLLHQALLFGGITPSSIKITQATGASYKRVLQKAREGTATLYSSTIWREEIDVDDADLVSSSATLGFGENFAGVYMHPSHPLFNSDAELNTLSAVSNNQWKPDWLALEELNLKRLYQAVDWDGMFRMVHIQRADFMLIYFSKEKDLTVTYDGMTLKAKPGIKVKLHGSRGWVVSKKHPYGARAYEALEKGIAHLHKLGRVEKAYRDSGVINPLVIDWKVINN